MATGDEHTRRRLWSFAPWIIIGALATVALILSIGPDDSASSAGERRPTETAASRQADTRQVVYRVTTSARRVGISLTLENASGNTEQHDTQTQGGTWERTLTMRPGAFAYLSAQLDADAGDISCSILVDGRQVEHARSSGAYVIASCSGSVE